MASFFSAFCAVPRGGGAGSVSVTVSVGQSSGGGMIIQTRREIHSRQIPSRKSPSVLGDSSPRSKVLYFSRPTTTILTCWPARAHTCLSCLSSGVCHMGGVSPLSLGRRQPTYGTYLRYLLRTHDLSARRMHAMCAVINIPARRKEVGG